MGGRVTAALAGTLMEEEDVEVRPERLPAMVTDVSVDICRIKKYFTGEAGADCEVSRPTVDLSDLRQGC